MSETQEVCPSCGKSLLGGLIYDTMLEQCGGDKELALRAAAGYGATETEGRWGKAIGVYDLYQDRTYAYQCPFCHAQWLR